MFLVELVLQGVRGIRELSRLRFQSGFNFVSAGNESGKTSSVDAMLRLLFPSNQPGAADGMVSRHTPDASRAALVAFADDGTYYRIIQDFSKRGVNLSKYNAAAKDFTLLYKDWDSTIQFMAKLTGGISEEEYSRIFVVRRDHVAASAPPAPVPSLRRSAPTPAAAPKGPAAAQQARLAELREALRKSEEAADADYRAQSAKLKLEETGKKMTRLEEIDARAADVDANLEGLKGCQTLPPDLPELLSAHEERQGQKMAKSDELTQEIQDLQAQLKVMPAMDLLKDKLFLGGAVLGIGSVIAGLFILTTEQAHYFPLGVLLALVLMAISWYKGTQRSGERKAVMQEIERLQGELRDLEKSFEQGGAKIEACMKATATATITELRDKAENYRYFLEMKRDIDQERERIMADGGASLQEEYGKLQQEAYELEQAAAAVARNAVDTYSLRQDIERIEAELAEGASFAAPGEDLGGDFGFAAPLPQPGRGGFTTEIAIASRVGGIEVETLLPAIEAAAQRNLTTVTGGKYVRIEAGHEGDPIVHGKDDSVVNFSEMSHGTRDLVYFCLRAGLVEALAGKRRLPFLLDDPLAGLDPGRQAGVCQILRTLGTKTQVILFTSNPSLRAAGDAAAELK